MNILQYLGLGIEHERQKAPCGDAVLWKTTVNGDTLAVLADGASLASCGAVAARANCLALEELFRRVPLSKFLRLSFPDQQRTVIQCCRGALSILAQREQVDLCQFAATLLFAVQNSERLLIGHLGDGCAVCFERGAIRYFSQPENRDEGGARTFFTSDADAREHLRLAAFDLDSERIGNVLLSSDGALPALESYDKNDRFGAFLALNALADSGELKTHSALAAQLDRIAAQAAMRLDDWSVLLMIRDQPQDPAPARQYSMYEAECRRLKIAYPGDTGEEAHESCG